MNCIVLFAIFVYYKSYKKLCKSIFQKNKILNVLQIINICYTNSLLRDYYSLLLSVEMKGNKTCRKKKKFRKSYLVNY